MQTPFVDGKPEIVVPSGSSNLSENDRFRQGVEVTTTNQRALSTITKIDAGNALHQVSAFSYGGTEYSDASIQISTFKSGKNISSGSTINGSLKDSDFLYSEHLDQVTYYDRSIDIDKIEPYTESDKAFFQTSNAELQTALVAMSPSTGNTFKRSANLFRSVDSIAFSDMTYRKKIQQDRSQIPIGERFAFTFYFDAENYDALTGIWQGKASLGDSATKNMSYFVAGGIPGTRTTPSLLNAPYLSLPESPFPQGFMAGKLGDMWSASAGTLVIAVNLINIISSNSTFAVGPALMKDSSGFFMIGQYSSLGQYYTFFEMDSDVPGRIDPSYSSEGWNIFTFSWDKAQGKYFMRINAGAYSEQLKTTDLGLDDDLYLGFNPLSGAGIRATIGGVRATNTFLSDAELLEIETELDQRLGTLLL
jgi:hypothetical protein